MEGRVKALVEEGEGLATALAQTERIRQPSWHRGQEIETFCFKVRSWKFKLYVTCRISRQLVFAEDQHFSPEVIKFHAATL
jgi:hypothetical protein